MFRSLVIVWVCVCVWVHVFVCVSEFMCACVSVWVCAWMIRGNYISSIHNTHNSGSKVHNIVAVQVKKLWCQENLR